MGSATTSVWKLDPSLVFVMSDAGMTTVLNAPEFTFVPKLTTRSAKVSDFRDTWITSWVTR